MLRPAAAFLAYLSLSSLSLFCLQVPALALERVARPGPDADRDGWSQSATQTIRYYNNCTGWIWIWSLPPEWRLGTVFETPPSASLTTSWVFTENGPGDCGYGFVGTISIHAVDGQDCPVDPPLGSQPLCIPQNPRWLLTNWGGLAVPDRFAVTVSTVWGGWVASDHPGAGPTGPAACGLCFPATRTARSYYWGAPSSPICPGDKLFDGTCDAELLIEVSLNVATSLEKESWGRIKTLYR